MKKSKSSGNLSSNNRTRPKSAALYKSTSKSSLPQQYGSQTARSSKYQKSKKSKSIVWNSKKRHPRIDDGVRKRYPEWRITTRNDDNVYGMSKLSPGPIYNPKDHFVLPQQPKWSLGRLIEDKQMKRRSPGPIYNPKYHFVKYDAPKFSLIARRAQRTFAQTTPAPNQYDPTKSSYYKSNRFYTLKGRLTSRTDIVSSTPGPTAYDVSKSMRKRSILSTKLASRLPDMTQNYLNSIPGPGRYIPKYDQTLHRSAKWTMGKRHKIIDSRGDNPGPGYYGPPVIPPFKRNKRKR